MAQQSLNFIELLKAAPLDQLKNEAGLGYEILRLLNTAADTPNYCIVEFEKTLKIREIFIFENCEAFEAKINCGPKPYDRLILEKNGLHEFKSKHFGMVFQKFNEIFKVSVYRTYYPRTTNRLIYDQSGNKLAN